MSATMDPKQAAKRAKIMKAMLGLSILLVLAATWVLKNRMAAREAAQAAGFDHPTAAAKRALQTADTAALAGDKATAYLALETAAKRLDEAIAEQPDDLKLARSRVTVARRLANSAALRDRSADAQRWLEDAHQRSIVLFERAKTDERGRIEMLLASRELSALYFRTPKMDLAAKVAAEAAERVEATLEDIPPSPRVRGALAECWLDAAKAHMEAKIPKEAVAAVDKALVHSERFVEVSDEPIGALARLYAVLAVGADAGEALKDFELAEGYELRAIKTLEARWKLDSEDRSVGRALAARHGRAAAFMARNKKVPEAKRAFIAAIAVRETLVKAAKKDVKGAVRDLTRTLNGVAAFHSNRDDDKAALGFYKRAVDASKSIANDRVRLIALGNYAQVLGRLDKMAESKRFAKEAYELAVARLAKKADESSRMDCVVAGLRHARLLRAKPAPNRRAALKIARLELDRLKGSKGKDGRRKSAQKGLESLIAELR